MADASSIRRLPLALQTAVRVLAVLTLVVVANLLSFKYYRRLDLSRASVPPLTERTKAFLQGMPRAARLIVFFNATHPLFEQANLLALQYAAATRLITVEVVNPYRQQDRATEVVQQYRIGDRENALIVECENRSKIVGVDELADFDRSPEAFGQGARATNFKGEQAVTGALLEVVEAKRGVIYFLHGQSQPVVTGQSPIAIFRTLLEREALQIKELTLTAGARVPADAALVISVGARYDVGEEEFKALRAYWDRGGKHLILLEPSGNTPRLQAWLGSLGVMVQDDRLYAHPPSGLISTVAAQFTGPTPIAAKFREVTPSFAGGTQSLVLEPARVEPAGLHPAPLLVAIPGFWGEVDWRTAGVNGVDYDAGKDRTENLVVAATVERNDSDLPEAGRLLVVSNAKYLLDDNITQQSADFTLAAVNWLLRREALVGIPPREMKLYTLTLPDTQLSQIFLLVVVAMPATAALAGLALWWRRRA